MGLIGDRINIGVGDSATESVTVGPGIEFTSDITNPTTNELLYRYHVDVDDDSFTVTFFNINPDSPSFNSFDVALLDLDLVDMPNFFISGVSAPEGALARFKNFPATTGNTVEALIQPPDNDGEPQSFEFDILTECFLPGTNILTNKGEVKVEDLKIDDLVQTADGKLEPIKWIGKQTVEPNRIKNPLRGYPILIKAGALGKGLPHRDLYTSPDHAYLVEGLLINAGALVNDVSIVKTEPTEIFYYYHVELENHSLLVAEGTAAESFYPNREDRLVYDNGAEYEELYPNGNNLILYPLDYPRVSSTNKVPRYVRQKLMQIAQELCSTEVLTTA